MAYLLTLHHCMCHVISSATTILIVTLLVNKSTMTCYQVTSKHSHDVPRLCTLT